MLSLFPPVGLGFPGPYTTTIPCPATLEACDPDGSLNLTDELRTIKAHAAYGISANRAGADATTWDIWTDFCISLHCDPYLSTIDDPIPLLQIFADRYRMGTLAPSRTAVRSRTVEGALRAVGQTFASLGSPDPRLLPSGKLDLRLSRQLSAYSKRDPPPHRVKPVPLPIITHAAQQCLRANLPESNAIADMLLLGFFFLLRPGEYACTSNPESCPFRVCDTHILINDRRLNHYTCSELELNAATTVALEFTNQKNGVRGELVGLGRSGHPQWCPVLAIVRRIKHFRLHQAPPTTPLFCYYTTSSCHRITTSTLTQHLRWAATAIGAASGITAADISVRSLRSAGAMALLCANVDPDRIQLLGRWRSDQMLRYLHVQAFPIVAPLAAQMVHYGAFALIPNNRLIWG